MSNVWVSEAGTPIGNKDGDDYFVGTGAELAEFLGGHLVKATLTGVRLAVPCGPDCVRMDGCWSFRSFYPAS